MCDSILLPLFHFSLQKSSRVYFYLFMIRANKILNRSDPEKLSEKTKYPPTTPDFVPEHQNQNLIHSVDSQSIFSQEARRQEYAVVLGGI